METRTVRTIKLTQTKTFTRTASIEVEYPSDLSMEQVDEWIEENSHWLDRLDDKVMLADLETDSDFDSHIRYDIYQKTITQNKICGGIL
jgi:predicted metal-dependent hydrolase